MRTIHKNYYKFGVFSKQLRKFMNIKMFEDIEFDVLMDYDVNKEEYAYIHIKDYSDDEKLFKKACKRMYNYLKDKNKTCAILNVSDRKKLFWVPKKKIYYITHEDKKI